MKTNNEINSLLKEISRAIKEQDPSTALISNCYFLKNGKVLALRNPYGDSRHPYSVDGLTLWAYSSGNIVINQSNFFVSPLCIEGKEPYINLYAGVKNKKGEYDYYSFFGNADINEGEVYTVFAEKYCYYIRKVNNLVMVAKLTITDNKKILISSQIINKSKKEADTYISFYFNPLLTHSSCEDEETKWFRTVTNKKNYSVFESVEDLSRETHLYNYAVLKNANDGESKSLTSRRMDYVGDKNRSIALSKSLRNGEFKNSLPTATFVDMAVYGDIIKKHLNSGEELNSNYQVTLSFDKSELEGLEKEPYSLNTNEEYFSIAEKNNKKNIKIHFGELNPKYNLNNELFNKFLMSVVEQVNYSSFTKNSSLMLLGIRDVYQMMEASLLWNPKQVREKIIESLSYIDISGRAPRQYSKETKGSSPLFDNREFIDQGQWIISTIWQYLAFTNDYSLLKEKCGYYELIGRKGGKKLDIQDTVYEHLIKIINFLISNIDEKTNCLRALYGDWNDAVDGLGASDNPDTFGNGVSVMATCHLYKNLFEMYDIKKVFKGQEDNEYLALANKIEQGILNNAIISSNGKPRIVHGWGNDQLFFVGSCKDVDGQSRYSSTSHAFFVMSGLYKNHKEYRPMILEAYDALDSKYGLKTFNKYFPKETAYKVGRIVNLPKGTAENGAVYIHAGMFYVRALLQMNEGEKAFDQIYKLIPITHDRVTTSPFVMPNSYGENEELGIDGESMSDWYTGSSNTLLKAIIYDMFGINPQLGSILKITPTNYFPSKEASLSLKIKGKNVSINYRNNNQGNRTILVNGEMLTSNEIDLSKYNKNISIEIID